MPDGSSFPVQAFCELVYKDAQRSGDRIANFSPAGEMDYDVLSEYQIRHYNESLAHFGTAEGRKTSRSFERDAGDFEGQCITERLRLPKWKAPARAPVAASTNQNGMAESDGAPGSMTLDKKKLVNRFMLLPYHSQLTIMRTFDLFNETERKTIPDTELFISCFQRAREKGVLDKVWDAIESEARKSEG